jgi:hypothetical protein
MLSGAWALLLASAWAEPGLSPEDMPEVVAVTWRPAPLWGWVGRTAGGATLDVIPHRDESAARQTFEARARGALLPVGADEARGDGATVATLRVGSLVVDIIAPDRGAASALVLAERARAAVVEAGVPPEGGQVACAATCTALTADGSAWAHVRWWSRAVDPAAAWVLAAPAAVVPTDPDGRALAPDRVGGAWVWDRFGRGLTLPRVAAQEGVEPAP